MLKVKCVYLTVGVVVLFGSKEYHLSCDQQHLLEVIAVHWQGCKMKVGFGAPVCGTSFVAPSILPMEKRGAWLKTSPWLS